MYLSMSVSLSLSIFLKFSQMFLFRSSLNPFQNPSLSTSHSFPSISIHVFAFSCSHSLSLFPCVSVVYMCIYIYIIHMSSRILTQSLHVQLFLSISFLHRCFFVFLLNVGLISPNLFYNPLLQRWKDREGEGQRQRHRQRERKKRDQ